MSELKNDKKNTAIIAGKISNNIIIINFAMFVTALEHSRGRWPDLFRNSKSKEKRRRQEL